MAVVLVGGLLCLLEHRRRSFAARGAYHESRMVARIIYITRNGLSEIPARNIRDGLHSERHPHPRHFYFDGAGKAMMADEVRASLWHEVMARKYRHAARYPWLPVDPDPPEPR